MLRTVQETNRRPQGRMTRMAMLGTGALVLGLLATAGWKSAGELEAARQQEERLASRVAEAQERIRELEARVARLDEDPATLERLAREELGMVRPGDVVIVLPSDTDGTPAARPPGAPPPP